jgi:hypothetical protein
MSRDVLSSLPCGHATGRGSVGGDRGVQLRWEVPRELLWAIIFGLAITVVALWPSYYPYGQAPKINSQEQTKDGIGRDQTSHEAPSTSVDIAREQQAEHRRENAPEVTFLGIKPGEWLLAIVTWMLWLATARLVRGADKTAERQLRAYVFVKAVDIGDRGQLPKIAEIEDLKGFLASFAIVRNSGQTPAYDVIHWAEIAVRAISDEATLSPPLRLDLVSANTIPPGGEITKLRWAPNKLSDDDIAGIKNSTKAIFVYGRIEYIDAFAKKRFTNYRLAFSGVYPPKENASMTFCNSGNRTDEHTESR